jgi:hypothetical protein
MKLLKTDVVFFGFGKMTNLIIEDFLKSTQDVTCFTDNRLVPNSKKSKKIHFLPYSALSKTNISTQTAIFTWRDSSRLNSKNLGIQQWLESKSFSLDNSFLLSSASVYKDSESIVNESEKNLEINIDKNLKFILENKITQIMNNKESNHINLRISNVYGNSLNYGLINSIINHKTKKSTAEIFKNLEIKRDYLEINDLIHAIQELKNLNIETNYLNVSTGIGTSLSQIINIFHKNKLNLDSLPRIETPINTKKSSILDCSKLKKFINWNPTKIEDGIASLLKD